MTGRLLLIDEHSLFRTGLRFILSASPSVTAMYEAGSVSEAVAQHALTPIDLIVLGVQMPGIHGLDSVKALIEHIPQAQILIVSGSTQCLSEECARALGVKGFVLKSAAASVIEQAVVKCLADCRPSHDSTASARGATARLTSRQMEVLNLLCKGRSNKAIAHELGLAENTVRVHVSAVFEQLQVNSRTEAVIAAQRRGLVSF